MRRYGSPPTIQFLIFLPTSTKLSNSTPTAITGVMHGRMRRHLVRVGSGPHHGCYWPDEVIRVV